MRAARTKIKYSEIIFEVPGDIQTHCHDSSNHKLAMASDYFKEIIKTTFISKSHLFSSHEEEIVSKQVK